MNKKFSAEERKRYMADKLKQLGENAEALASICFLTAAEVEHYLNGSKIIEDKEWVQLGLGLMRLAKKKGIPTEKEEKKSDQFVGKKISRTSIIRRVEALDVFDEKTNA